MFFSCFNKNHQIILFKRLQLHVFHTSSIIKMQPEKDKELQFGVTWDKVWLIVVFDLKYIYSEVLDLSCAVLPPSLPHQVSLIPDPDLGKWLARLGGSELLLSCPDGTFANPVSLTKGVFFKHAAGTGCTLRPRDHTWINLVCLCRCRCLEAQI